MVMSPKFRMRPTIDWWISKSEKPEGERTKDWRLAKPVLTSRLPLRNVYLCDVRSITSGMTLAIHTRRNAIAVHVQTGMLRMVADAALSRFSKKIMIAPRMMTMIVLATASGVIHGLSVQIMAVDSLVDNVENSV
jgi:hypothetical protein